ncbi:peptidoglycan-binding domain-containing protein [Allomesorhizobium alhagi]|uniref:Peptidoglycan binding domain-containing protein n=1 Tax=Mesorhizobium alhagi CCNWXJ12-2 TaxID=1107882 RepID=H0HNG2_9HYPH|nr:peptidoglycan-binding domain-containing protein [Mesorhizobium alhagi]EHK57734.1 peptidoglycan binding domain-containing protein [Mesorhizobium alhagi CCNWXJ12-2]
MRAGYSVKVDGDFGAATKQAVMMFQSGAGLTADGVAGPETMRALGEWRQSAEEQPGEVPVSEVDQVKDATKGGGLLVLVVAVRDQIAETASYLTGIEAETSQTLANGLMAGSAALGIGLAAYALYGWWKSRQTDEGDVPA